MHELVGKHARRDESANGRDTGWIVESIVMRIFAFCMVLTGLSAFVASAQEKPASPKEEKITFDQHILPIFREKCGSCHN